MSHGSHGHPHFFKALLSRKKIEKTLGGVLPILEGKWEKGEEGRWQRKK